MAEVFRPYPGLRLGWGDGNSPSGSTTPSHHAAVECAARTYRPKTNKRRPAADRLEEAYRRAQTDTRRTPSGQLVVALDS